MGPWPTCRPRSTRPHRRSRRPWSCPAWTGSTPRRPLPRGERRRREADLRRLTLKEVNEQHGGILPPDATLRTDEEPARPAPPSKPKRRSGRGERFGVLNAFTDAALADLTGAEAKVWLI